MSRLDVTIRLVLLLAVFVCGSYAQAECGSLLAPDATGDNRVPPGWHLCYIPGPPDPIGDEEIFNMECRELLKDLPMYGDASGLLAAGGNFGCWNLLSYPDPDMSNSCNPNLQHTIKLGNCLRCTTMAVCVTYPPPPTEPPRL